MIAFPLTTHEKQLLFLKQLPSDALVDSISKAKMLLLPSVLYLTLEVD